MAGVKKVVIGIHDQNKDVTGKGFLRLQERGIATELFPHDLAQKVKNSTGITRGAQQSLGIKIDHPKNGESLPTEPGRIITMKGTWINKPEQLDTVHAIVQEVIDGGRKQYLHLFRKARMAG